MNSEFDRSEFEVKPARSKQILASLVYQAKNSFGEASYSAYVGKCQIEYWIEAKIT